ncbi:hypothetical protein CRM22_003425 [Opisthorchis felineus]|uniref:Protein FAM184A/B N-terminal domain-containing protein n=1 Tax=Opisthorchis felineus TaxID=147828 RepID=A0A4S2M668_OPIFE|nr:hypothetical protein CRM22_003425 [Opisthorchis felineus]TGZ69994.1 hypothetical protein CRM22_003425 [Opisthorchis felineus]
MSMDAAQAAYAEAGACKLGDVHYKMSKKIAQLTKVIYMLNCKKEDVDIFLKELQMLHKEEISELQRASEAKLKKYRALAKESHESNLKQSQLSSNMESLQEKLKLQKELYDRRILEMTFEQKKIEEADEIKIRLLEDSLQEATTELALCQLKLEDANMTLRSQISIAMDTFLLEDDGLKLQREEIVRLNEELMQEKEENKNQLSATYEETINRLSNELKSKDDVLAHKDALINTLGEQAKVATDDLMRLKMASENHLHEIKEKTEADVTKKWQTILSEEKEMYEARVQNLQSVYEQALEDLKVEISRLTDLVNEEQKKNMQSEEAHRERISKVNKELTVLVRETEVIKARMTEEHQLQIALYEQKLAEVDIEKENMENSLKRKIKLLQTSLDKLAEENVGYKAALDTATTQVREHKCPNVGHIVEENNQLKCQLEEFEQFSKSLEEKYEVDKKELVSKQERLVKSLSDELNLSRNDVAKKEAIIVLLREDLTLTNDKLKMLVEKREETEEKNMQEFRKSVEFAANQRWQALLQDEKRNHERILEDMKVTFERVQNKSNLEITNLKVLLNEEKENGVRLEEEYLKQLQEKSNALLTLTEEKRVLEERADSSKRRELQSEAKEKFLQKERKDFKRKLQSAEEQLCTLQKELAKATLSFRAQEIQESETKIILLKEKLTKAAEDTRMNNLSHETLRRQLELRIRSLFSGAVNHWNERKKALQTLHNELRLLHQSLSNLRRNSCGRFHMAIGGASRLVVTELGDGLKRQLQEEMEKKLKCIRNEMEELAASKRKELELELAQYKKTLETDTKVKDTKIAKLKEKVVKLQTQMRQKDAETHNVLEDLDRKLRTSMSVISETRSRAEEAERKLELRTKVLEDLQKQNKNLLERLKLQKSSQFTELKAELDKKWASTVSRECARVRDEMTAKIRQQLQQLLISHQKTHQEETKQLRCCMEGVLDELKKQISVANEEDARKKRKEEQNVKSSDRFVDRSVGNETSLFGPLEGVRCSNSGRSQTQEYDLQTRLGKKKFACDQLEVEVHAMEIKLQETKKSQWELKTDLVHQMEHERKEFASQMEMTLAATSFEPNQHTITC